MSKKYMVDMCHWCPHVCQENGKPKFCWKMNGKPISTEEISVFNNNGEVEKYTVPEWCPLENY